MSPAALEALLLGIPLLVLVCTELLYRRAKRVLDYRLRLLHQIDRAAKFDIQCGLPYDWRFDAFETGVPFAEMVFKFWRPLDSFYADQSFVEWAATGMQS